MVKIRLTRMGRHKSPFYRIVATDSRKSRNSDYIELLGTYDPLKNQISLNKELIVKFLSTGAQPTETVLNILKKDGIWKDFMATKAKKKPKANKSTKKTKKAEK